MRHLIPHSTLRYRLIALWIALLLIVPWVVLADQIVNTIDSTVDSDLETVTITAGGSTTVGFYVKPENDIPAGDVNGCNATGSNPATVTLSVPAGVTASPTTLTFKGCGTENKQEVTFASSTPGSYTISVASVTGGRSGSLWETAPAAFTLKVQAPQPPSDTTPPVITPSIDGTLGDNDWYVSDVIVSWAVTDDESAITSTSGCDSTTIDYDTTSVTLTCTATSAGGTSSTSVTIKRDATPPTISGSRDPEANANGWNNTDVTVSFTCSDAMSGIAACTEPMTLIDEGVNQSVIGTATDQAGNTASATVSINIDKTPPTWGDCPARGPFLLNSGSQSVGPIEAVDALSGIDEATSTLSGTVDTSTVGLKTVTFTAADRAGNNATKDCHYRVVYAFGGILQPINADGSSVFKLGSTIPVKFQLTDAEGNWVTNAVATIYVAKISDGIIGTELEGVSTSAATTGNLFRYDATSNQYIFNLGTRSLSAGTWRIKIALNDGTAYEVFIGLRK